tara:strand:- start:3835 stop:4470 length:636 start_codon:yes stop_codon:yes gene_type:complete
MKTYVNPKSHLALSPVGRLSYPALFEAKRIDQDKVDAPLFYQASLLIPKGEEGDEFVKQLTEEAKRVAKVKFGKSIKGLKISFLKDGDTKEGDENDGMWILSTKNKNAVPVVDRNRKPILKENGGDTLVYAGSEGRISFDLWAWDHKTGGKGVSANLSAYQRVADGEPLGRKAVDADDAFGGADDLPPEEQDNNMSDSSFGDDEDMDTMLG